MPIILRDETMIGSREPSQQSQLPAGIVLHRGRIVFGSARGEGGGIPQSILDKLKPQNNTGLGSTTAQGTVLNTQAATRTILSVANTYLTNKLTADEMAFILSNRSQFEFIIGVGDRRAEFKGRFALATNWRGEDVTNFQLRPNPAGAPEYDFRLTFSASAGTMTVTDNHVGTRNTYGSLRYFTIRQRKN
ncbi:hypothetical protein JYL57_001450 [Salmonella enterica subsp. enterica serovar Typhimurium]|uniref:hypothetical protein n=1 Tax=Salmonella enterica TaxID=28901 RepID=UPI00193C97B4|nr:hypothetical protein [Salmonella enterica]EDY1994211.1 hypothetical protein [Salmonella enterica subsp. diarizonae]EEL2515255.1 hypothetical protein [Salmonella enterica]EEN5591076.1 hypothetical protein [Salmonella enterica subsp. enterica serovar Mountpleasant]EHD9479242.1 hypothetical protein [Salmonella enterica subsp. enterica serovar Typhimurium]